MGLAYGNPPFSLLAKVITKIAYEEGKVVMCTPDWGRSGEHAYWCRMLDQITVGSVQLPDAAMVPFTCLSTQTQLCRPLSWASFPLSMDLFLLQPIETLLLRADPLLPNLIT